MSMDMLHCYNKGVRENFPQAEIVFDRYHLMVMAGEAVDEIRRQMQRTGADLKGSPWALRGNEWNLKPEQQEMRQSLCHRYKRLGRASALRDALQDIYEAPKEDGPALLEQWCVWTRRSRMKPIHKLAWTIRSGGKVSRITSISALPKGPSKRSRASSKSLNVALAAFVTSSICARSPIGIPEN
jgi:transposase